MKYEIVGKNGFEVTEAIKNHAIEKIKKIEKYFKKHDDLSVRVVCKTYSRGNKVEITIPAGKVLLRAEVTHNDMYNAIDNSIGKLESQIRKHKTKTVTNIHQREGIAQASIYSETQSIEDISAEIKAKNLVKTKNIKLEEMTKREAFDQMELLGHDFFIFLDSDTKSVNVVYLREDMDYAVIETNLD